MPSRLMLSDARVETLRRRLVDDRFSTKLFAAIRTRADRMLRRPPPERVFTGPTMLHAARDAFDRILTLGFIAVVSGEEKYADRARLDIKAVAEFSDWNPAHFLDTAELCAAVAIGLSWLGDGFGSSDRRRIVDAIVEKALKPSLQAGPFWIDCTFNWNPVCHAGMALGALATLEEEPSLARTILRRACEKIPLVAPAYQPDGAYDEGPMYWTYGTTYLVMFLDAMDNFQENFGESSGWNTDAAKDIPGLNKSAEYMLHVSAPGGTFYNYSDSCEERPFLPALFYFAESLGRPQLTSFDRRHLDRFLEMYVSETKVAADSESDRFFPLAMMWNISTPPPAPTEEQTQAPLFWMGTGRTPVALMRTSWNDPDATFVGIKGGSPSANHGHMDVGGFVLESRGVRWAIELPAEVYRLVMAAGVSLWDRGADSGRWKLLRVGADGHNILRFAGPQNVDGFASIERLAVDGTIGAVRVDLTLVYAGQVGSVSRTMCLFADHTVEVTDRWSTASVAPVRWQFLTRAAVRITTGGFTLEQDGCQLHAMCWASGGAIEPIIEDLSAAPQPYESANPLLKRVVLNVPANGAEQELRVRFGRG